MKKVYVVTSGDYSDYHIESIFSKKEKASEFIEISKIPPSNAEIEEYEIDKSISDFVYTIVQMKRNGDTIKSHHVFNSHTLEGFRSYTFDDELMWAVKTNDEKRAIKVINEKRIQILAAECWNDFEKTSQLFNK